MFTHYDYATIFWLLQYFLFYSLPIKLVCLELEALTFFNVMQTQTLLSDQTFHIIFPCPIFGQSMRLETIFIIYKSTTQSQNGILHALTTNNY